MRAHRQQVGAQVSEPHVLPPDGLGGVDVHEHAALAEDGDRFGDRLPGADLVVAPLQVDERGVVAHGSEQVADVDVPVRVDRDDGHLPVAGGGEPDGRVLDRGDDLVTAGCAVAVAPADGGPPARRGDGLGRTAGEHDLARSCAEQAGHLAPCLLDRLAGGQALGVDAPRVAGDLERRHEGVAGHGPQRRRRGVIKVRPTSHVPNRNGRPS